MRLATLIIVLPLAAGCSAVGGAGGEDGLSAFSDDCNARRQQSLVGGPVEDMAALALAAPKVRIIDPGDSVTAGDEPDRLNVERDADGTVTRVYCG